MKHWPSCLILLDYLNLKVVFSSENKTMFFSLIFSGASWYMYFSGHSLCCRKSRKQVLNAQWCSPLLYFHRCTQQEMSFFCFPISFRVVISTDTFVTWSPCITRFSNHNFTWKIPGWNSAAHVNFRDALVLFSDWSIIIGNSSGT